MQKLFLCLALLSLLSGCGKKAVTTIKNEIKKPMHIPQLHEFRAEIEGVECAMCAEDVVNIVKKCKGVHNAEFVVAGNDYEQGYVRFYYDVSEQNIDLRDLDEMLRHLGFELTQLNGSFYFEPFSDAGKKFVALSDEVAMPFCYSNNQEMLKNLKKTQAGKLFAQGAVKKDPAEESYFFAL